jgi:tetratricopeptide (TPR) repeat protein
LAEAAPGGKLRRSHFAGENAMRCYRTGGLILIAVIAVSAIAQPDAVTDAKRRAAADLMKEGKTTDAIALIDEVLKADPTNYKDHLLLARGYDKLNKAQEAVDSYHRVLELLNGNEDRLAKAEAERRLKVLDGQSGKIQAAEDEFLKKLDILEHDAIAAKDMLALQHVFALRGGLWNARGRKEGFGVDLPATAEWLDSCAIVKKGVKYHVRAAGYWTLNGNIRCTADGTKSVPATVTGVYGSLVGVIDNGDHYEHLGTDCTFVASMSGRIRFTDNVLTREEREKSSGGIYILVQPVVDGN